ncbi:MAG: hypothetical protein IIV48_08290, partial [Clostridium sp.]|nr:hypothetical protein [Clostridium sp.]
MIFEKAFKRQRRYNKVFIIMMVFLAIFLPSITYLAYISNLSMLIFLSIIEVLIFIVIIMKFNSCNLKFYYKNNILKLKSGIFSGYTYIQCDKVLLVHTDRNNDEIEIIIITSRKNKKTKVITRKFKNKYRDIEDEYMRLKRINKNTIYYFQIIKYGELKKYMLLDNIYK